MALNLFFEVYVVSVPVKLYDPLLHVHPDRATITILMLNPQAYKTNKMLSTLLNDS